MSPKRRAPWLRVAWQLAGLAGFLRRGRPSHRRVHARCGRLGRGDARVGEPGVMAHLVPKPFEECLHPRVGGAHLLALLGALEDGDVADVREVEVGRLAERRVLLLEQVDREIAIALEEAQLAHRHR